MIGRGTVDGDDELGAEAGLLAQLEVAQLVGGHQDVVHHPLVARVLHIATVVAL